MMQPARVVHQEEEEEEDQEFVSKKDAPLSNSRDGKNNGKASTTRSKHSVTEQRRRCKINERFQMLRDLIPHSDQKRDTASFLLEVIEYVQFLQEKVQKYEGSYQGWSSEPTKLTPWRNSHWRIQSFSGHPEGTKNGSGGSMFAGRFDDSNISTPPTIHPNQQNPIESDSGRDTPGKTVDELANKSVGMPIPLQVSVPTSIQGASVLLHPVPRPFSDAQSTESPVATDTLNQQEDLIIEGGSISITSVYSDGLLNNLTQALQSAGIDLSQATVSVQIDLGKRANRGLTPGVSIHKDPQNTTSSGQPMGHFRDDVSNGEGADQAQKRLKM